MEFLPLLSILTIVYPWYFLSCFPLVFLENCCSASSSEKIVVISLCLDSMIQKVLVCPQPRLCPRVVLGIPTAYFFSLSLYEPLLLGLLLCLILGNSSCFLYSLLYTASFSHFFQVDLELFLFFMPLLCLLVLLFKHFYISLEYIRGQRERYDDNRKKVNKKIFFLFIYL